MNVFPRKWKNKDGSTTICWCADFINKFTKKRCRPPLKDCKSELAARRAASKLYGHLEEGSNSHLEPAVKKPVENFTISLGEMLERHRKRPGVSDWTRSIEKNQADNLIEKFGYETPLSLIQLTDLDDYVEARQQDPRGKYKKKDGSFKLSEATVGGATIMKELKLLNQALRWAASRDMDVRAPFTRLPNVAVLKKRPRCLTEEEMRNLLEACGDDTTYLRQAVEVCYYSGLRRAELFRLTWKNVDFDNQRLRFFTHKRGGSATVHDDIVYIPKRAIELLTLRFEQAGKPGLNDLVFGKPAKAWQGVQTTVDQAFSQAIEAAAKRAGIPRHTEVGAHTLRHSCATHMLRAGTRVPDVAAHLRHRDGGSLLLRTYSHVFEDDLRNAAGSLAGELPVPQNRFPKILAQNGTKKVVSISKLKKIRA